jgi:hypothetical protein
LLAKSRHGFRIFPSVQIAGKSLNFVLFHKSARVEEIELPGGTEISSSLGNMTEDGWEDDYTVIEEIPLKRDKAVMKQSPWIKLPTGDVYNWSPQNLDTRPLTLKVDLESVRVHQVDAVQFETTDYVVRRHRWERRKSDPSEKLEIS